LVFFYVDHIKDAMMKVVLYDLDTNMKQRMVAVFEMKGSGAVCSYGQDTGLAQVVLSDGVMGKKGRRFMPVDGQNFLEALFIEFSGAYLRAEKQE
jgi:hypothetical protein